MGGNAYSQSNIIIQEMLNMENGFGLPLTHGQERRRRHRQRGHGGGQLGGSAGIKEAFAQLVPEGPIQEA